MALELYGLHPRREASRLGALMEDLVWRPIPGFDPRYEVSECGRIKGPRGIMRPRRRPTNGYYQLTIRRDDGKQVTEYLHRLVALAWCDRPDGCDYVDHGPEGKDTNHARNLNWVTNSTNVKVGFDRGERPRRSYGAVGVLDVGSGLFMPIDNLAAFARERKVALWGLRETLAGQREQFEGFKVLRADNDRPGIPPEKLYATQKSRRQRAA